MYSELILCRCKNSFVRQSAYRRFKLARLIENTLGKTQRHILTGYLHLLGQYFEGRINALLDVKRRVDYALRFFLRRYLELTKAVCNSRKSFRYCRCDLIIIIAAVAA